jgi:hypothetical protein
MLGLQLSECKSDTKYNARFDAFSSNGDSANIAEGELKRGMLLKTVNDKDLSGIAFAEVKSMLGQRPCNMYFGLAQVTPKKGNVATDVDM